jgi:hypothetical protein
MASAKCEASTLSLGVQSRPVWGEVGGFLVASGRALYPVWRRAVRYKEDRGRGCVIARDENVLD